VDYMVDARVEAYIQSMDGTADPVLEEMEELARKKGFPIVGAHAGKLLGILARASGARRVLELGSGFGYSAWWLARSLPPGGRVTCTDFSADNRELALGFLGKAGLADRIEFLVGDALELARARLGAQPGGFDIVFNDIDKLSYPESVPVAASLLRPGGLFITDNVLWSGRVAESWATDPATRAVRRFNELLRGSADLEAVMLPVHDGLTVAVKLQRLAIAARKASVGARDPSS
jgi:caffeoyl-CoA O-methyltransferase